MSIITKVESARGCGYRKPGGIYLVSDGIGRECMKLPIPLTVCPCCSAGIKQSRGFTWINTVLFSTVECSEGTCGSCVFNWKQEKIGLLWVGEKFYPTINDFSQEARKKGVSKRISQVPKDFEVGKTWIALAHPKAITSVGDDGAITQTAGIFHAFRPIRIEYVITGTETDKELQQLEKRGFTLVKVVKDIDTNTLFAS